MRLATILRELFGDDTQVAIAARLTDCGIVATQPTISAWLHGRKPLTIEQMNVIEACYGRPRGWILTRAGFVDPPALIGTTAISENEVDTAAQRALVRDHVARTQAALRALEREQKLPGTKRPDR